MKDKFKIFVKNNPSLITYVRDNKMTWQQFYELYDLYGEDNEIWNTYLNKNTNSSINQNFNVKDFFSLFKGIDLATVQKALMSVDKAIGTFRELNTNENSSNATRNEYEERPKYKYFED